MTHTSSSSPPSLLSSMPSRMADMAVKSMLRLASKVMPSHLKRQQAATSNGVKEEREPRLVIGR